MTGLPGQERSYLHPLDTIHERDRRTDGHPTTAKTALTHSVTQYKKVLRNQPIGLQTKYNGWMCSIQLYKKLSYRWQTARRV